MPFFTSNTKVAAERRRRLSAPVATFQLDVGEAATRRRRHSLSADTMTQGVPASQRSMFQDWWNDWLSQRALRVSDSGLDADVRRGEKTIALCELVTGGKALPADSSPRERNIAAMSLLRAGNIPLISANGSQRALASLPRGVDAYVDLASRLTEGSWTAVASLTWSLILFVDVVTGPDETTATALSNLLEWVHERVGSYTLELGRTRYAWSDNFADGLVWAALLHSHNPPLIDFAEVSMLLAEERLEAVFLSAKIHLSVYAIATASDVMSSDPRVAIAYTAALRNAIMVAADQQALDLLRGATMASARRNAIDELTATSPSVPSPSRPTIQDGPDDESSVRFSARSVRLSAHSRAFEMRRRRVSMQVQTSPSKRAHVERMSSIDRLGMAV